MISSDSMPLVPVVPAVPAVRECSVMAAGVHENHLTKLPFFLNFQEKYLTKHPVFLNFS